MMDLAHWRGSHLFTLEEKLVLEFADCVTATPVDVPDALFANLRERFNEAQLVELTSSLAWENYRARFAHAFGIEAQGFSEGAYCPLPVRPSDPST
jgi:alkylhydroperoxidase family enzyme